ncbi:hypothetical protein AB0I28_37525 [Phytomonospora sp. NPDC050363]|uniref:hypothetical protein n=1 Tax=Phytomonospora sp. NPDC050363 TaxID=3155642 RepID=UPI0033D48FBB
MSVDYDIHFAGDLAIDELTAVLVGSYNVERERIYVGDPHQLYRHPGPDPYVMIERISSVGFGIEFQGDPVFARANGDIPERDLAAELCRALNTSALLSTAGRPPDHWTLVGPAGDHGEVLVDGDEADEGRLIVVRALEPISSRPDLPAAP